MIANIVSIADLRFSEWLELWFDYVQPHLSDRASPLHEATYARLVSRESPLQGLALKTGVPIGFAHFYYHPSTWSTSDQCYLQDLYVAPAARGRGHAERLIRAVAQIARQHGCSTLHWRARPTNAGALSLYARLADRNDRVSFTMPLDGPRQEPASPPRQPSL